jgi:hypothetical protein
MELVYTKSRDLRNHFLALLCCLPFLPGSHAQMPGSDGGHKVELVLRMQLMARVSLLELKKYILICLALWGNYLSLHVLINVHTSFQKT